MKRFAPAGLGWVLTLGLMLTGACTDKHTAGDKDASQAEEPSTSSKDGGASSGKDGSAATGADGSASGGGGAAADGGAGSGEGDGGGMVAACPGGCDDGNDCTEDTCDDGTCAHRLTPSLCDEGFSCSVTEGCVQGKACGTDEDCADDDACTINERCDPSLARCLFAPLDRDGDGEAPLSCGGTDCDDDNRRIRQSASEACDGVDNDCDSQVDDGAMCGEGEMCSEGACVCNEGLEGCGFAGCVDLKTDANHCGDCMTDCGSGGACVDGACTCPAPGEQCGDTCANVSDDMRHCGGCEQPCARASAGHTQSCVQGACVACGAEGEACCTARGTSGCTGALTCSGEPGAAGAKCECPATAQKCGDVCVDVNTSETHCGNCDNACTRAEQCQAGSCVACGGEGQACCSFGGTGVCARGLSCGDDDTCS